MIRWCSLLALYLATVTSVADATLTVDGTIENGVPMNISLPQYDPEDPDGTTMVLQYGSEPLPLDHQIRCHVTEHCVDGEEVPSFFFGFKEAEMPTAVDDDNFPVGYAFNRTTCGINAGGTYNMDTDNVDLYIALTSWNGNVPSAVLVCDEDVLDNDGILENGVPSEPFSLDGAGEPLPFEEEPVKEVEDAIIQSFQFGEARTEAGYSFECVLECTSESDSVVLAATTRQQPAGRNSWKIKQSGSCPMNIATPPLSQPALLFFGVWVNSTDTNEGIQDAVLTCNGTPPEEEEEDNASRGFTILKVAAYVAILVVSAALAMVG